MPRKVLQIIPTLVRGGAEKQLTLLACGLPRNEFETHVAVLTHDGPLGETLRENGIEYTVIGKSWKADPSAYFRLKKHIDTIKPDLVHTWLFAANSFGRYAAINAKVKAIVAGERCVDPWKSWYQLAIDRYLAKKTDAIVTNSTGVQAFYAKKKIPSDLFRIIPNGVEPATETPIREQLLDELGIPKDSKLIGAIGRLWPQKRLKDLIWATDIIKCVRDDTHLLIVGDGPQRWRLERYAEQVAISDRVHFLGSRDDAGFDHCVA